MKYIDDNSAFTKLREKAGLSVQEVADRFGYTLRTVYRWEKGEIKPRKPVTDLLLELASKGNDPDTASGYTIENMSIIIPD